MQQHETPYVRPMPKFELWEVALVRRMDGGYLINRIVVITGVFYSRKVFENPFPQKPVWAYHVRYSERDDLHSDILNESEMEKFPPISKSATDLDDE